MKIYTKQGDSGKTALFDGTRVGKDDLRVETYGTVDELNSHIGLVIVDCAAGGLKANLETLQRHLFDLGADLATPTDSKNAGRTRRIGPAHVAWAEREIDGATAELPALKKFILPGGCVTAARLHVARTVCRRAERHLVRLMEREPGQVCGETLVFLNRLSDLLFTWARLANVMEGRGDVEWSGEPPQKI